MTSDDVRSASAARLFAEPLDRLQAILERGEQDLELRRHELTEVRVALSELVARAGAQRHRAETAVERLSAALAPALLRHLVEAATDVVRSCAVSLEVGHGLDPENVRHNQGRLVAGQFRQRTIYPMSVMESANGRAWVRSWADVGEEQRLSIVPPSDFAVFDDVAVVAVARWADPGSDYVLIRDPMLIAAFTELFDRSFARALPVTPDEVTDDEQLRLVRLLGLGLKDESIARYLGCSLRTVRRRVASLMTTYGVQTRFQLGVAVAQLDLATVTDGKDR